MQLKSHARGRLDTGGKRGGGGVHPYNTFAVCGAQRGRDFGGPGLERGIHFRDLSWNGVYISNARKFQFCRQSFEIIQGEIALKNTLQCVKEQTVARLLAYEGGSVGFSYKVSRTGYNKLTYFLNSVSILGQISF